MMQPYLQETMDDTLEIPCPRAEKVHEGDDHSSGDEDGGLDWTNLPTLGAAARPIIPKRGEKDFEPAPGGESGLQLHVLDRSRDAMFGALRANRAISRFVELLLFRSLSTGGFVLTSYFSKTISYGIWHPSIDRVHVTTAHGIHFSTMGYSISRIAQHGDTDNELRGLSSKQPKRLELLPEEALYLIERGALFCYKSVSSSVDPSNYETKSPGAPMSVQQAFAEMIGREEMTLERYQVYAYLKRLGFILMRAEPPTSEYPAASPVSLPAAQQQNVTRTLTGLFSRFVSNIITVARLFQRIDWWRRLQLHRQKTTQDIFRALRFIPCGHTIPLYNSAVKYELSSKSSAPSPYKIFFHMYKPSTPFRKTAPPAPDFHVVVVDARTTSMPSLQELTALFCILPEMQLPPPRKRGIPASTEQPGDPEPTDVRPTTPKTVPQEGSPAAITLSRPTPSWSSALWTFFQYPLSFLPSRTIPPAQSTKPTFTPPKPNPFLALKTGKKTIVIAAVDTGSITFFRFGQGVFEEWPII
ncbi:tRNA-splicing endonuclease subunit sen54 N-term-domain-containing protein [Lanmaoa asiatica]|nr:tRNA-splicing endonuclease subunit sen54 N-term-domain-containing protein [Lanmaoa asiatica]KAH0831867.1 tRNA-splicing endonuclease subunit sen54 N-term-domain-containing protein [Lanmaoa asiatica]